MSELKKDSVVSKVITKSYLEGCPIEGVKYIKSKRDKFFVVHAEFSKE